MVQSINETSQLLHDLLSDEKMAEEASVQNRMAIDNVLLKRNHGYEEFDCLNQSDRSTSIEKHIADMKNLATKVNASDGNW